MQADRLNSTDSSADAPMDVEKLLSMIVLGGNALTSTRGGGKQRRRVPSKQEKLVRLVASKGSVAFLDLSESFDREWKSIVRKRRGQYILLAKQEFFRNMADLAGRVNEALLAAYRDPESLDHLAGYSDDRQIVLAFDHQAMTISWVHCPSNTHQIETVRATRGGGHVPYRGSPPGVDTSIHGREEPLTSHAPGPEIANAPRLGHDQSSPHDLAGPPTSREALEVTVDPITEYWCLKIGEHDCQIMPALGYVKVDGRLLPFPAIQGLVDLNDLGPEIVSDIRRLAESMSF